MTRFIIKGKDLKAKKILAPVASAIFWIALWQLAYLKIAQELLLVSPAQAFARLFLNAQDSLFWISVAGTCLRVLLGFLLALVFGFIFAAASARFSVVYVLVSPLFGVIRATPVASFIILVLLWIKTDMLPAFISFLMVLPMIWSNLYTGIRSTDKNLLEMARLFKMPRRNIVSSIYAPSLMPHFVSACSVGLGFAWKSAIAAEIICLPKAAIGRQIYNSRIYLETADLFAWTIAVIILSIAIEKLTLKGITSLQTRLVTARGEVRPDA